MGAIRGQRLVRSAILLAAAHLLILLGTRTVLDANISLDARQAAPAFAFAVVSVGAWAGARRLPGLPGPLVRRTLAATAALAVFHHCARVYHDFDAPHYRGYTAPTWFDSPTLAALATAPADLKIITNAPDALWLHQRREPVLIPRAVNPYTKGAEPAYEQHLADEGCFPYCPAR